MSPAPLTVNAAGPVWRYEPPTASGGKAEGGTPGTVCWWFWTTVPTQDPEPFPCRATWSKRAEAEVGEATPVDPRGCTVTSWYSGEVAKRPICTVLGSPARRATPTTVQSVPFDDSEPVRTSPDRASRSQRGDAA